MADAAYGNIVLNRNEFGELTNSPRLGRCRSPTTPRGLKGPLGPLFAVRGGPSVAAIALPSTGMALLTDYLYL
jgi:hypothetical protein